MYVKKKKNSDKKRYRSIRQQNPFQKQHENTAAAREEPPENQPSIRHRVQQESARREVKSQSTAGVSQKSSEESEYSRSQPEE